ncbi:MAG: class I SAM-dependent methyltransferase [Candidatus Nitrosocaldus sp.]
MEDIEKRISEINLKAFSKMEVAIFYSEESLQKTEEVILNNLRPEILNKKILEIGVGGGKTIRYLTKVTPNYIGIDYSYKMVALCRQKYPGINILHLDARDMSIFPDDEFDFVLCAFNSMDYVGHSDRLKILREVFRILKKDGYFVFSTHNREGSAYKFYLSVFAPLFTHNPFNPITLDPLVLLRKTKTFFKAIVNHIKNSHYCIHSDSYSIINDKAHDYTLMTYYIGIEDQKRHLRDIGFSGFIKAYDRYGNEIIGNCEDTWIYYLVKK